MYKLQGMLYTGSFVRMVKRLALMNQPIHNDNNNNNNNNNNNIQLYEMNLESEKSVKLASMKKEAQIYGKYITE